MIRISRSRRIRRLRMIARATLVNGPVAMSAVRPGSGRWYRGEIHTVAGLEAQARLRVAARPIWLEDPGDPPRPSPPCTSRAVKSGRSMGFSFALGNGRERVLRQLLQREQCSRAA